MNWAIAQGYVDYSPFKRHGVTVVKLNGAAETPRDRRLDEGDEEKLLAAYGPRTKAIIIAALENRLQDRRACYHSSGAMCDGPRATSS